VEPVATGLAARFCVSAVVSGSPVWFVFVDALAAKTVARIKIPPRSPNHIAVVERFQSTMPQVCRRPVFYRLCFSSMRQLQRQADVWLHTYNHHLRNHDNYMAGRRPIGLLKRSS